MLKRYGRRERRPSSLKRLLLLHELALLLLVVVTVALGGAWGHLWQRSSEESVRINALMYQGQQARSDLYRQIKEVTEARLTENPAALELYQTYTRRLQRHFDRLRQQATKRPEQLAVQALESAYRLIQQDMNKTFTDPYVISEAVRMKLLNPRYEDWLVGDFERALNAFTDLLSRERELLEARLARYTRLAWLVIPLPILLASALVLLSRRSVQRGFVHPVAEIMAGALKISQGQLEHRIPERGVEEMANLARAINTMARDLAASRDALVEKERQAALGALVPVVAHNIRNPLASIRATAQVVEHLERAEDVKEAQEAIIQTVDRLERWVRSLLSYLHPLEPHCIGASLANTVEGALTLLQPKLREKDVRVVRQGWAQDTEVAVDVDLMEQALYGLLLNAVDASPEGGTIVVALERVGRGLRLLIHDQGPGMPFDPQPGGLAPGPSTKRSGTGLGIPFAFKVCQAHGWGLDFMSHAEGGTTVTVSVPSLKLLGTELQ